MTKPMAGISESGEVRKDDMQSVAHESRATSQEREVFHNSFEVGRDNISFTAKEQEKEAEKHLPAPKGM